MRVEAAATGWAHAKWSIPKSCGEERRGSSLTEESVLGFITGLLYSISESPSDNCSYAPLNFVQTAVERHLDRRIVGGQRSFQGEWKWLVAIGLRSRGQQCGGSLIASQWVLTAAHCIRGQR